MRKQITILVIFMVALLLVGGGCKKEEEKIQKQEQEENKVEDESASANSASEATSAKEAATADKEDREDISMEAKEEYEQIREQSKDCQRYNWSTMNEGPYRDKISYALSTDLLNWTDSGQVLAEHASVPGAVIKDNTIYVYYVDVAEECYPEELNLIMSSDSGQTWSEPVTVYIKGLGAKVAVDPAPYLLDDGRIRLYYFDIKDSMVPGEDFKIYSAVSTDGMYFAEEEGVRFSNPGTLDPDVIRVDDAWKLYTGNIEDNSTILATSSDGLSFTYENVAFQNGAVPDVFYKDGTYYLFTAGIDVAISQDGVKFNSTSNHFQSAIGMVTADPSVVELSGGIYMMMYKTSEGRAG